MRARAGARRTLRDLDASMANLASGKAGRSIDAAALLKSLDSRAK